MKDKKDMKDWTKLAFTDIDGVLRGKVVHKSKIEKAKTLGYCDVVFGWDLHDKVYPQDGVTGWQSGFSDAKAKVDERTKRKIPWDNIDFYIMDFSEDVELHNVCPRSLLKNILNKYEDLGYQVKVGYEYEWFNFTMSEETLTTPAAHSITTGMFGYSLARLEQKQNLISEYLDQLSQMDITIEGFHTETGPGVYEAAIKYDEALRSADRAILFKHFTKAIFRRHGILASFMAKWNADLPGCSGHIHLSIIKPSGEELKFADLSQDAEAGYFLAGLLDYMPAMLPLYAPTVNSYKRLVSGSWAPTTASWGIENRTSAVRIIPGEKDRMEIRIPGSDCNPYLALYGILSAGYAGIQSKVELKQKTAVKNAYTDDLLPRLSESLSEAYHKMNNSEELKNFMNPVFLDHYLMTRKLEYKKYQHAVTDWEIKRYLEII